MYPSRTRIATLNACRIVFLILALSIFVAVGFGKLPFGYSIVALIFAGAAFASHMDLEDCLEVPASELRDDKDPLIRDLARQLSGTSMRNCRAYIRIPMKHLKGKAVSPDDVKVAIASEELDYDFSAVLSCRRYSVQRTADGYSLEYCDFDAQYSIPLPWGSKSR